MIRLRDLLKEETFTAISKESGKVSVFKSKQARDLAIKAGTHTTSDKKEPETVNQPSTPSSSTIKAAAARAGAGQEPQKKKGFWHRVARGFGLTARPAKPEELKKDEPYRITSKDYLANVEYIGKLGNSHQFRIIDMYKDLKPLTGRAPKSGDVVSINANDVEQNVVVDEQKKYES